jgi:Trk-type K+ transport system membrane component
VPISSVYIGLQVLYVVITMRHSNVYEERSLGIYAEDEVPATDHEKATVGSVHSHSRRRRSRGSSSVSAALGRVISQASTLHDVGARAPPPNKQGAEPHINFITQQIHGQLAHDIWWLMLAIPVIVTINTGRFLAEPVHSSVFNVIFEVVSAYGCVGISVGAAGAAYYSFSGSWHPASKLVLCAVMFRGRHRGLPVALDCAVRLPREELHREEEEEDQCIRRSMATRRASVDV